MTVCRGPGAQGIYSTHGTIFTAGSHLYPSIREAFFESIQYIRTCEAKNSTHCVVYIYMYFNDRVPKCIYELTTNKRSVLLKHAVVIGKQYSIFALQNVTLCYFTQTVRVGCTLFVFVVSYMVVK